MGDPAYSGRCIGGPLDGEQVTVRTEGGFLAVDRVADKAWIYQRQDDGTFRLCTDHDNSLIYPHGTTTGERRFDEQRATAAAEHSELDIIAVETS